MAESTGDLVRAVAIISEAYEAGRIDPLVLAAEMDRIGRVAREGVSGDVEGFTPSAERVNSETEGRIEIGAGLLPYQNAFLDDILRGIVRHDLILVGAETGAGKTDLVTGFAREIARSRKHVFMFALEAEPLEIERRIKFAILNELADKHGATNRHDLNYADWYLGRCEKIVGKFNIEADEIIRRKLSTLHTFYRGSRFSNLDIQRLFIAASTTADLMVLDHLHVVDLDEDVAENQAYKRTVQLVRNLVLVTGVPCMLVAHLRKQDGRSRRIVPRMEDFHGSSDIGKVATRAILIAPAHSMPSSNPVTANTFVTVPKDRVSGATGLVALHEYHRGMRSYGKKYRLGRQVGDQWEELPVEERPRWAGRCA